MPEYKVMIYRRLSQRGSVIVEADDAEDAINVAQDLSISEGSDKIHWNEQSVNEEDYVAEKADA